MVLALLSAWIVVLCLNIGLAMVIQVRNQFQNYDLVAQDIKVNLNCYALKGELVTQLLH